MANSNVVARSVRSQIGKILTHLRIDYDETCEAQAKRLGLTSTQIYSYNTGNTTPPPEIGTRIIESYGLTGETADKVKNLCRHTSRFNVSLPYEDDIQHNFLSTLQSVWPLLDEENIVKLLVILQTVERENRLDSNVA